MIICSKVNDVDCSILLEEWYNSQLKQQQKINGQAINWLNQNTTDLWPNATTQDNPHGLNWNLVVNLENRQGKQRFCSQYWRVNITLSEHSVLSVPGSYQFRLQAHSSWWDNRPPRFNNLCLTEDWVDIFSKFTA